MIQCHWRRTHGYKGGNLFYQLLWQEKKKFYDDGRQFNDVAAPDFSWFSGGEEFFGGDETFQNISGHLDRSCKSRYQAYLIPN